MTGDVFHDPRITAMGLLSEVHAGILARVNPLLAEHRLSLAEFDVLIRLSRSPESRLRMSDLAAQTILSTSGITRVVDRLERDGLVVREACATDRRSTYAVLTEAGTQRMAAVLPAHNELVERWFTGLLTDERRDALMDALRTVRDAVRPEATAGVSPEFEETCLRRPARAR